LTVWLALALGLGLWTAAVASAVQLVVQAVLVFVVRRPQLFTLLAAKTKAVSIAWRRSVLPLQWRIALQGIALYLATQALTLVLMETQTPEVAGRWGMTWTILLALQSMATAWLTAAFPHATQLAAERRWSELRGYWVRTGLAAGALLAVGIAGFAITLQGLAIMQWNLADRFIAPRDVLLFGIGMVAYHAAACLGYVVRAQRRESLYWAATLGQALVAAGCWYGCARGGVTGLCVAYAAMNLVLVLPLHVLAWWLDRRGQESAARAP
jgi:O-antigen/teichoic acid export membrane protein